jgi:hypothetical protein
VRSSRNRLAELEFKENPEVKEGQMMRREVETSITELSSGAPIATQLGEGGIDVESIFEKPLIAQSLRLGQAQLCFRQRV